MTLVCITNEVHDLRSCTIPDQHWSTCDGWEYEWAEGTQQEVATGRECPGCLPVRAERGLLCARCYGRLVTADAAYASWIRVASGHVSLVSADASGVAPIGYVPLGALALDVDAIQRARRSYPGDVDMWIHSPDGAADAVRFSNEMHAALHKHPVRDAPRRLTRTRCPECGHRSLIWTPPIAEHIPAVVKCGRAECGHTVGPETADALQSFDSVYVRSKTA